MPSRTSKSQGSHRVVALPTARELIGSAFYAASEKITPKKRATSTEVTQPGRVNQRSKTQTGGSNNGYVPASRTGRSKNRQGSRQQGRMLVKWTIPVEERPEFALDEGKTAQLFNCLPTLLTDAPGAALGTVIFMAMHQPHRYQGRALNSWTRLAMQIRPNRTSLARASAVSQEMRGAASPLDIATADLTYWEQQSLLLACEMQVRHSPRRISDELLAIAEEFKGAAHDHPRREASARIMAAAILHVALRDYRRSTEEMVKAIALIGEAYPDEVMTELARSSDPTLFEQTVGRSSESTSLGDGRPFYG